MRMALLGLLLGVFAVLVTPREEEPQIDVTFADVFIPFPGATAEEVERLVAGPAEQVLGAIAGIKHVYSQSRPGQAIVSVEFRVGEARTAALVRLYDQVYSHSDWLPATLGTGTPIIKPKGIDDVPILTLTLWSREARYGAAELAQVAHTLEAELKRVPGTRDLYTVGAPQEVVAVRLDPARLAGYGLALDDLRNALASANASTDAGRLVGDGGVVAVQAGSFLGRAEELGGLVVGLHAGAPVYLSDVADIERTQAEPADYVRFGQGQASGAAGQPTHPAVTLAITKKPGSNAVSIAAALLDRVAALRGVLIPEGVELTVSRDYGTTADDKAQTLIHKLIFATSLVIALVWIALGARAATVVGSAVIVTLAITLFASWAWGFTLNRVSLFALIFSIGILVDDAIVVVENVHRHLAHGGAIPAAVDEVGGPTILATLTVIAALLPMAFVTGLMGPYMAPIPINASLGMLISLAVAFILTPWLSRHLLRSTHAESHGDERLHALFARLIGPFTDAARGGRRRWWLLAGVLLAIGAAASLVYFERVVLKMLPFDNKSEFELVVDMPAGTPLERTLAVLEALGREVARTPEVTDYQIYAGTSAPIGFNGLVRQYYLRSGPTLGEVQVNLLDRHQRERKSHDIARALRPRLAAIAQASGAVLKLVEVPPGPPVQAPIVAEIYGLDRAGQEAIAWALRDLFASTTDIVDVDVTLDRPSQRLILHVDRNRAAQLGVSQAQVAQAVATLLSGEDAGYLHGEALRSPLPIRLELPPAAKADSTALLDLRLRARDGTLVALGELVSIEHGLQEQPRYRKDGLPVIYVLGDMAGHLDSPLYGMAAIAARLQQPLAGRTLVQHGFAQPDLAVDWSLKWDGEWQITWETFRDMGLAYAVGLLLIWLLIVAQFGSYTLPLVIMAPIPLTLVGILPGHALLGQPFTATSMIGMIALAGIIVRNSILLVDFVRLETAAGRPLAEAVIAAAAVRARPIALTGLAAMLGALFILDDPIFGGLAISLIFGVFVSTLLTLVVIPVSYFALQRGR